MHLSFELDFSRPTVSQLLRLLYSYDSFCQAYLARGSDYEALREYDLSSKALSSRVLGHSLYRWRLFWLEEWCRSPFTDSLKMKVVGKCWAHLCFGLCLIGNFASCWLVKPRVNLRWFNHRLWINERYQMSTTAIWFNVDLHRTYAPSILTSHPLTSIF